ncbi:MAG TPA: DapH/DapD/GlmU-related protein [Solimonas sp.]
MKTVARLMRALIARSRPFVFALRRFWVRCSRPGVVLGDGVALAPGVLLQATDGGGVVIGRRCTISRGVSIVAMGARIEIGDDTFVGPWSTLTAKAGLRIGNDCLIAERVTLRDQNHDIRNGNVVPLREAGYQSAPIVVGDDVWIAAGVVVLKGVTVGDGAVIAANAVVVRDVGRREIAGGVPAKILGHRDRAVGE